MAVKNKKKKVGTLAEAMHGGQNSESPAVAYSRCLHRNPQYCEAVSTERSQQTQSAVSANVAHLAHRL